MDLNKKMKKFFTLIRKADGGFTLVELIVVIAILAVSVGVAVPAYNGYVKKADRAADEVLLNEINTAFASACALNGESHIGLTPSPALNPAAGKKVIGIKNIGTAVVDDFASFFEAEDTLRCFYWIIP